MKFHKISSTDAFISFDLDDAPATGITRVARKILVDGATLLARSTTYTYAAFGVPMGGASAGINADDDGRDAAVAAFVAEVTDLVASGQWITDPGTGITEADLAPLAEADRRSAEQRSAEGRAALTATTALAAAGALRADGLAGVNVVVVGAGPEADATRSAATALGATVLDGDLTTACEVLFVAGKTGTVDHDVAATVSASALVPLTPLPVTARAHAVLSRAGCVHVPDFVAIAGPLLAAATSPVADPAEVVAALVTELAPAGTGLWMAAIERAEAFLLTWQDALPTERPLA